jgi:hypothetical protein
MGNVKLEELAAVARSVETTLGNDALAEVAELALLVHHQRARAAGVLMSPAVSRPWEARSYTEQIAMRSAVRHVVIALVLLRIIELPGEGAAADTIVDRGE